MCVEKKYILNEGSKIYLIKIQAGAYNSFVNVLPGVTEAN